MEFINDQNDFDFNEFARYDVENKDIKNLKNLILTELGFKIY